MKKQSKFRILFTTLKAKLKIFWYRHRLKITIYTLIFAFIIAFFWKDIFISIGPGEAGVFWKRLDGGIVTDKVYGEGLHIIAPWNKMDIYTLRFQEHHDTVKILTTAGLYIEMDISFRYYPERKTLLPMLHKEWGPQYAEKFVIPESKAAAIAVLGQYLPKDLYSLNTTKIQEEIKKKLDTEFAQSHIILHDFLITRLALPEKIKDAIERKLTQEQLLLEYDFRLSIAKKEKDRKVIEASGIRLFENISRIPILKWKGLDVTAQIATSDNAKVVVIGTQGLPIILNADK